MTTLILFAILELVKRIASAILYPFIYPFRSRLRTDRVLWPEYLYYPKPALGLFWLFLDDSIRMETKEDCANQTEKYPALVNALGWTWLKCYWWSAIRNSMVNLNNFLAWELGVHICDSKKPEGKNFIIKRIFTNGERPYCEFWILGRRNQIGWIKRGRFEIDVMKKVGG